MKICMILGNNFFGGPSGIDMRVYKEARSLIESGHEVYILHWAKRARGSLKGFYDGIKIVPIFHKISPPESSLFLRGLQYLGAVLEFLKLIRRMKTDVIHCHDLDTLLIGVLAKKVFGTPVVYDSHEFTLFSSSAHRLQIFSFILEMLLSKHVDDIIAASEGIARKGFKESKHRKIVIIYNSRSLKEVPRCGKNTLKGLIRKQLGLEEQDFLVGFIGTLSQGRGLEKLIEAISYIKNPRIKLLIMGGPWNMLKQLKSVANNRDLLDKTLFHKSVPYHEVLKYFMALDVGTVLYQPTELNNWFTISNKLFDYILLNIPVIVSCFPEYRDIVLEKCRCGLAVDATKPREIAKAIKYFYNHPEILKGMQDSALECLQRYSWERQARKLVEIYDAFEKCVDRS